MSFPREFFLICICGVCAVAFTSIRLQVRGLYGEDGIEPVDVFLRSVKLRYASGSDDASTLEWIARFPTLVWLHEPLQWTPSFCMEVICLVGATMAVLGMIQPAWRTSGPLVLQWVCYFSIVKCGQTFMQFQWDSLLLEVGVLAVLLAPWWYCRRTSETFETPAAAVWTLRFLFFKFMLMSGAVKIQSRCPTWLGLSALDFHFASQPLPLPLSWYALQAPPTINRLAVAVTLLIEGPWTFFLLAPHPILRRMGAIQQIALQISILLTGNYNFFNLLTIILAAALLDIDSWTNMKKDCDRETRQQKSWIARVESVWHTLQTHILATKILVTGGLCFCVYTWLEVFEMTIQDTTNQRNDFLGLLLASRIRLLPSVDDTQEWLARILPRCTVFTAAVVLLSSCRQLARSFSRFELSPTTTSRSRKRLALRLIYLMTTTVASVWIFTSSVVTLSVLDQSFQQSLPSFVISTYYSTEKYRVTNAYGLFRTMTGVGTVQLENGQRVSVVARPEVILEGTKDGGLTWQPYHFKYKPGDVDSAPRLVAPFHPRLDWQMWFAALGDYNGAPWLVNLVSRLLEGSSDVKKLLDTTRDPFPDSPPDAIRAQLYYYDFTRLNTTWNRKLPTVKILSNSRDLQWWTRTYVREYLPALERGNPSLAAFVQHHYPESPSSVPEPSSSSSLRYWVDQRLKWLCSAPWSPVGLAAGFVLAQSGVAALFRCCRGTISKSKSE